MYALVCFFDKRLEDQLHYLWQVLHSRRISDYAFRRENHRPHLTLASLPEVSNEFVDRVKTALSQQSRIELRFEAAATFLSSDALLLFPVPSIELLRLHEKLYPLSEKADSSYYLPGSWIPHVTIANYLNEKQLTEALTLSKQLLAPAMTAVTEIAIIKIEPTRINTEVLFPLQ